MSTLSDLALAMHTPSTAGGRAILKGEVVPSQFGLLAEYSSGSSTLPSIFSTPTRALAIVMPPIDGTELSGIFLDYTVATDEIILDFKAANFVSIAPARAVPANVLTYTSEYAGAVYLGISVEQTCVVFYLNLAAAPFIDVAAFNCPLANYIVVYAPANSDSYSVDTFINLMYASNVTDNGILDTTNWLAEVTSTSLTARNALIARGWTIATYTA
jgi:hypothetical protein